MSIYVLYDKQYVSVDLVGKEETFDDFQARVVRAFDVQFLPYPINVWIADLDNQQYHRCNETNWQNTKELVNTKLRLWIAKEGDFMPPVPQLQYQSTEEETALLCIQICTIL